MTFVYSPASLAAHRQVQQLCRAPCGQPLRHDDEPRRQLRGYELPEVSGQRPPVVGDEYAPLARGQRQHFRVGQVVEA